MARRRRQSHLRSVGICCYAALSGLPRSADAFSMAQNAAASSQQSRDDAGASGGRRSAAAAAAIASSSGVGPASAGAANPFRGSLNGRRPRTRQHSGEPAGSDFALRMSAQSDAEGGEDAKTWVDGLESMPQPHDDTCSSECQSESQSTSSLDEERQVLERRKFLSGMLATTAAGFTAAMSSTSDQSSVANAYELAYPIELQSTPYNEVETSSNSLTKLKEERLANKKAKVALTKSELRSDPLGLNQSPYSNNFGLTIAGASTWALALWFATGSRSNPVVTPLANVLYDDKEESWLSDRNDGYFAELPLSFTAILSAVFVFFGVLLDRAVYFLADGDAEVSLQLAGVSVIGGAVWEVGRLAAKEKAPTRDEYERDVLLYKEFDEFATKRIVVGRGSCHRSDVISAFRRYNPKYRQADSEQYPLADIEIERILKNWNRQFGSGNEMSSAGFFSGITIDSQADAFAPR